MIKQGIWWRKWDKGVDGTKEGMEEKDYKYMEHGQKEGGMKIRQRRINQNNIYRTPTFFKSQKVWLVQVKIRKQ